MKMEEERECFQRSREGDCVSVEAQLQRDSERATKAPLPLGPKWPFIAVSACQLACLGPGCPPGPGLCPRSPAAPGCEEQGCAGG